MGAFHWIVQETPAMCLFIGTAFMLEMTLAHGLAATTWTPGQQLCLVAGLAEMYELANRSLDPRT
jgi:hypothetical protein